MGHPRPLYRLFLVFSNKHYNFWQNIIWKLSIQHAVLGFEPAISRTRVSSRNHKNRASTLLYELLPFAHFNPYLFLFYVFCSNRKTFSVTGDRTHGSSGDRCLIRSLLNRSAFKTFSALSTKQYAMKRWTVRPWMDLIKWSSPILS